MPSTCAITRLEASNKVNVVAANAATEIDCRLSPPQDPEQALQALKDTMDGEGLKVETLLSFGPSLSPTDNFRHQATGRNLKGLLPEASELFCMAVSFTYSHFFRGKDIPVYGFSPLILSVEDVASVPGNNEKISLQILTLVASVWQG